jgi:hypothetical protein
MRQGLLVMVEENRQLNARVAVTVPERPERASADCAFLALVVALSAAFYVHRLGFASDDWAFLGGFTTTSDPSLFGLIGAVGKHHLYPRPVHAVELGSLYWLFGPNPFGYHVVQTAVLATIAVLFYLVLRRLHQPRLLALAAPAVYLTSPSYSAARFWYTDFVAALSGLLWFATVYMDLRSVRARPSRWWMWRVASLFTLLASALAYEVFLPLFVINPFLAWNRGRQLEGDSRRNRMRLGIMVAATLIPLAAVGVYKARTSARFVIPHGVRDYFVWIARRAISPRFDESYYGFNVWQAIGLHFGNYGIGLLRIVWRVARHYADSAAVIIAVVVGLTVFAYLARVALQTGEPGRNGRRAWLIALIAGPCTFALGYAIFLMTPTIQFTPTGLWSRTSIAAAAGVSLTFVGAAGSIAGYPRSAAARAGLFCGIVALLCASGVLILNAISSFYVAAYREERAILASIRRAIPKLPPGSTLILDGVCPYVGPGIVFESNWDLEGALRTMYGDATLRADVVTPRMSVDDDSLSTRIYGANEKRYPYHGLVMFHPGRGSVRWIANAAEARGYFSEFNPDLTGGCPGGTEGHGVAIFD